MPSLPDHQYLQTECHLDDNQPVLVGVSGGADSLCLLDILLAAGLPVIVAHANHQLRSEADAEMAWVRRLANEQHLDFVAQALDVPGFASASGVSVEEAARELRYQFLFEQAVRLKVQAVAVGHTADDQAETVLMNFLRGSGLNGLKGMPVHWLPNAWSSQIALVRPLLFTWRQETEAYCRQHGIQFVQDASNQDQRYRRNLLRHEVIPYLEKLNPRLRPAMVRMSQALRADQQIVERAVQAAWEQCVVDQHADWVAFDRRRLSAQPVEIRSQLLRRAMALHHPGLREIDFASVQRAVSHLDRPAGAGSFDLTSSMRLLVEDVRVWVADWKADLPGWEFPQIYALLHWDTQAPLELEGGWILHASRIDGDTYAIAQANSDPYQAFLALPSEEVMLEVRPRRNGDRYQPLGMESGSLKVSDYMINRKIPRRARAGWVMVVYQGGVAWIPGGAPAHPVRVQPSTRRALRLYLTRSKLP